MFGLLKRSAKSALREDSLLYNVLALAYGCLACKPGSRRAALIRIRKDGSFNKSELHMASSRPVEILDKIVERFHPKSFLDVGCGVGMGIEYLMGKGIDCVGLEGSTSAIEVSPVPAHIRLTNLNQPVDLKRKFDIVWTYEVAEHIHADFADTFLDTLVNHGNRIAMSAAQPGQGGCGHFNEQPLAYWIAKMDKLGFQHDAAFSAELQRCSDPHAGNMMFFDRRQVG